MNLNIQRSCQLKSDPSCCLSLPFCLAMSLIAALRTQSGGKGSKSGKGKGDASKRAVASAVKADPNWIKAVSESAHAGKWMQYMYCKASDDGLSAEFCRPDPVTGEPLDKCSDFTANLTGEYVEEFNKVAWGFSESACTIRHALKELATSTSQPTSLFNPPVMQAGLKDLTSVMKALEVLDLGGPSVPRGEAELADAVHSLVDYSLRIKATPALRAFWDVAMKDALRLLNLAYRVKILAALSDPSKVLLKLQHVDKQDPCLKDWQNNPNRVDLMEQFLVRSFLNRLNVAETRSEVLGPATDASDPLAGLLGLGAASAPAAANEVHAADVEQVESEPASASAPVPAAAAASDEHQDSQASRDKLKRMYSALENFAPKRYPDQQLQRNRAKFQKKWDDLTTHWGAMYDPEQVVKWTEVKRVAKLKRKAVKEFGAA